MKKNSSFNKPNWLKGFLLSFIVTYTATALADKPSDYLTYREGVRQINADGKQWKQIPILINPPEGKAKEQIKLVKDGLSKGLSVIFYPNPSFEQKFGYLDSSDNIFNIGRYTFYERRNKFQKDLAYDLLLQHSKVNRATAGVAGLPVLNDVPEIKNPYRVAGLRGEFSLGGAELGRTLVLKQAGYFSLLDNTLVNAKNKAGKIDASIRFLPEKVLIFGKEAGYEAEESETVNETYAYQCSGGYCTPLTNSRKQVTKQAGMYEQGAVKWIDEPEAHVVFKYESSPVRLQVPEKGKLYITDLLMISPESSFSWNAAQCKNKVKDASSAYLADGEQFKECPVTSFNYKVVNGTKFIDTLKKGLLDNGWPRDLVDSITYLPMSVAN
jgi:hypothetical protein